MTICLLLCSSEAAIVDNLINLVMKPSTATLIPFIGDFPWYFVSPWVASIIYLISYDMYMADQASLDTAGLNQDFMFGMAMGSMEDAYEDVWGKRFKTPTNSGSGGSGGSGGNTIPGSPGDDGVVNSPSGLGGPAPCLENYISVQETIDTGADPHAVHGIQATDGAFVAVGSGK